MRGDPYYYSEEIRQTWEDVLDKFGCSHPEQLNFLFNEEESSLLVSDYSNFY